MKSLNEAVKDLRISNTQFRIYAYISMLEYPVNVSTGHISKVMGIPNLTVKKAINDLQNMGYLTHINSGWEVLTPWQIRRKHLIK